MRSPVVIFITCLWSLATTAAIGGPTSPNLLIITCDNLGYGDLPMYRPESPIRTPHLDRLASEGARFTSFYTASPTCSVSRACLLTGRVPQRHGLLDQLPGVAGNYGIGLDHEEILLPQVLKQAPVPYTTACFGKWNIGFGEGSRPTERGFDEFVGHVSGNLDYFHHNYREKHDLYQGTRPLYRQGEYSTDIFADAAVDFIERQAGRGAPWMVYLPFNAPHFPNKANKQPGQPNVYQAPDWAFSEIGLSAEETDAKRRYDAVVYALDKAIGRVLAALDDTDQAAGTLVFFMSDNGAFRLGRDGLDVGLNLPLRSGGVTCWEGGLRVAALARWPGHIPPGAVIDEAFWSPDVLVTCAALAGVELPADRVFDGRDVLRLMVDKAPSPHRSFYFEYRQHAALRMGDWKIVRERPGDPWLLFDLAEDIAETRDRATDEPQTVRELAAEFERWRDRFSESLPIAESRCVASGSAGADDR